MYIYMCVCVCVCVCVINEFLKSIFAHYSRYVFEQSNLTLFLSLNLP